MADTSSAVGITQEMIAKGAQCMRRQGVVNWHDNVPLFITDADGDGDGVNCRIDAWVPPERVVRAVLEAALAGCTVIDLPEPTSLADESRGRPTAWDTGGDFTVTAKGGSFGARVNIRGGPYLTASAAEARGAALIAAAREARRLASGSSKGGDPTRA